MKKDILKDLLAKRPERNIRYRILTRHSLAIYPNKTLKSNWQRILRSFRSCKVCFMHKTGIQS